MKNIIFLIGTLLILASCKSRTTVLPPAVTVPKKVTHQAFFDAVNKKETIEAIKISNTIEVNMGSYLPPMNGTFYIENNKKVWVNLQVLFMNVARGLASPSGIKAYEKANKTYIDSDFSYLNNLLKVNFIDFMALQKLLLGKTFLPVNEDSYTYTKTAEGYMLSSSKNIIYEKEGKKGEYRVTLDYAPDLTLKRVYLEEIKNRNTLEISYGNHEMIANQKLPRYVKIIIKGNNSGQIIIENTKFELLKMETPFSIPSNYTKTEIK